VLGFQCVNANKKVYNIANRLDGSCTLSKVVGSLLSPYIFEYLGYFGNYCLSSLSFVLAILYLVFFVKEPIDTKKQQEALPDNLACNIDSNLKLYQGPLLKNILHSLSCFVMIG
jgi:hypothetical protein